MRNCPQCKTEMLEGFDIKVEGGAYGIKISETDSRFSNRLEKPKVAICPNCGEISMYIKDIDSIVAK